jgi:hypothetical protein
MKSLFCEYQRGQFQGHFTTIHGNGQPSAKAFSKSHPKPPGGGLSPVFGVNFPVNDKLKFPIVKK